MEPVIEIRTTFPDRSAAEACARRLLDAGLAACVQIDGPVASRYRWRGAIEGAEEWRCTCKTTAGAAAACADAIATGHPYEVPEILVARVEAAPGYARWIAESVGAPPAADGGTAGGLAFEVVVQPLVAAAAGAPHADAWGEWPTLAVDPAGAVRPFSLSFDESLARFAALEGVYAEPDGSVVGVEPGARRWQFDAQLADLGGRLLSVDLRGSCPPAILDRVLGACGWPADAVMMQLPRAGVFFDEATFRRHAAARFAAGDARTLRPG